ncbi:DUF7525 family protein [Halorubrum vacuolatum]|uniref:Uncharacterized protein n=1 Tax=Halorubrum vacuolatum TaxID=63740 RepID=A0A238UWU9_HALVU|nr:hypothetical protein [Halorubrum vacuolatum]SNR26361.1 hypothetical protein SAMN06264855_101477 [Halorubrum vacuolatum]
MSEGSMESDKGLGVMLALAAVAVVGAVVMYGAPTQLDRAWGFAAAIVFALLAVVTVQVFE